MATRSKDFLVVPQTEVIGSKLPSNREVLGVVLHRLQLKKTTLRDVTLAVTPMVAQFWDMARIPMIRKDNIVTKIEKLHREYELLKKGRYRRSEAQISKEKDFEVLLDNLFDVAHGNALTMMTNQEDKQFLLAQREPGRRGRMGGVDSVLVGEAISSLGKGRCFLRPQTRRGCRLLICGAARVLAVVQLQHFSCCLR